MSYQTIRVRFDGTICFLQFHRPEANNTINGQLIDECHQVLDLCEESATVVVLEGLPNVFCFGADFQGMRDDLARGQQLEQNPELLYNLWLRLATGPYVTVSYVRGKANAGGLGFVSASDIVLADETAQFSLSELLFGLYPACVLPFLLRRTGYQKAHYLTLMTTQISVQQAQHWGLVDAYETAGESLLRKHLLRLRRLSKTGIARYKRYLNDIDRSLHQAKSMAVAANREMFSDPRNVEGIFRFVEQGRFPWEGNS